MNTVNKFIQWAVLLLLISTSTAKAQNFTSEQNDKITNQMLEFLYNYISYSDVNSNQIFLSKDYYSDFGKLNRVGMNTLIFNDLAPDSLPEQIKLEQYLALVKNKFSAINIKTIYKEPFSEYGLQYKGARRISQVIEIERTIIGFTKQKKVYRAKNTLYMVVSFDKFSGYFFDLKLDYISKQKPELLPLIDYTNLQPELGMAYCSNNVKTDKLLYADLNAFEFNTPGYKTGIGGMYNFSRRIGAGIGLNLSQVAVSVNITSDIKPTGKSIFLTDKDGDQYVNVFTSAVSESTSFSFVNLPIFAEYRIGNHAKLHGFVRATIELAAMVNGKVNVQGNSELKGYYPSKNLLLFNMPEYGFVYKDINTEIAINKPHLTANTGVSAGVILPIGARISISGAVFYQVGLNPMFSTDNSYRTDYVISYSETVNFKLNSMGANVSLRYKFIK